MFKYANDTDLLVPQNTDIPLSAEFSHMQIWAKPNGLIVNFDKIKELVLHRKPYIKHSLLRSLEGVERVHIAKLLEVIFQSNFSFVNNGCNFKSVQSVFKQLREQKMPLDQLHKVFQAIILGRQTYSVVPKS